MGFTMNKNGKYYPLFEHLRRSGQDEVALTFAKIEALLGCDLPDSARSSRGWWSNRGGGGLQSQAWMEAGYHVVAVDLGRKRVTFRKPVRQYTIKREGDAIVWTGELVKALRAHMDHTQSQLADELGVRQQTISEWESGVYEPSRAMSKYLTLVAERAGFEYSPRK
jgi:DNA-binding transcriptional regulator YiaG